ncbi:MAG TPA: hypothetical protein VJO99_13990 [Burkholderiaceae bacterium]|nr:hypothetical protein [Burkholderiaceae bacterium]
MTIFRWIIGVIAAIMAGGSLLSFAVFIAFDVPVWLDRARVFRRWMVTALLLWFNVEVWGRVVWTLIHW